MKSVFALMLVLAPLALAADVRPVGTAPSEAAVPRLRFAFEERVTLSATVEFGETAFGQRRYIPITGGSVAVRIRFYEVYLP